MRGSVGAQYPQERALYEVEEMVEKKDRKLGLDIAMTILTVIGLVLFCISYMTGYYIFGQTHSIAVLLCIFAAVVTEVFGTYAREKYRDKEWPHILVTVMIVLICWGIGMLLMDRVEAVGNCVVTDFDSGHGGEEAVYISFASISVLLIVVVLGIIKSFISGTIKVVGKCAD